MSTKKNKVSNKKMYDDVNLTKPRREPKYNALVSYTRMRRKLKIEYLLPGGRVVQARCRILSSLLLNRQRQNVIYLFYIIKKGNIVAKIGFVVRRKTLVRTPFNVIMIYTKHSSPLAVDNSEMVVISLSLNLSTSIFSV